jgi:carbamate kinase
MKTAVVAIGGNSLIKDPEQISFSNQSLTVAESCPHLARLIELGYELVVTHGNGPQVGFMLLRSHLSRKELPEIPLDACNAITQGELGYLLEQNLKNELEKRDIKKAVVCIITQVLVDKNDPAFENPTKPVGPFYTKAEAFGLQREQGWTVREDAGRGFRRVVPSPKPLEILEYPEIKKSVANGTVVISVGGGGIPVIRENGRVRGIAAVIDKDRASSLLAARIGAQLLLISTQVDKVYLNFDQPEPQPLDALTISQAKEYLKAGQFPAGSMGPKIEAAVDFLENGGETVIITNPPNIERAVQGAAGTRIVND